MPDRIVHHGAMGQLLGDVEAAGSGEIVWWEVAEREIDLRSAAVRSIALHDVSGPLVLRVHPHTQSVFLAGDLRKVEIFGLEGEEVIVQLQGDVGAGLPRGLDSVAELQVSSTPMLDLAVLHGLTRLRSLTVRDVPGRIASTSVLGALPGLERIRFYNTYDIDAAAFPRPEMFHDLQLVSFDGLFTSDAKVLRERLKGFWNAHVNHPRSAKWMAENINNPFRSWGDDDRTLGRRANELWRNALTDARRQDSVADSLRIVTEFTDGLRVLAEEFPLDTLCREQATEALDRLAHLELGLPEGTDAVPSQGWEW